MKGLIARGLFAGTIFGGATLGLVLPAAAQTDVFQGSVPAGQATQGTLRLSLQEAIARGLQNNLGVLERINSSSSARADRLRALSELLPNVTGSASETASQVDLATFGFRFPGFPQIIGPFGYTDVRAYTTATLFDWEKRKQLQSANQNIRAAELSYQDARDLVVQAVASSYLQIIAGAALVDGTRAQVATAQALYERARDQHAAGVSPAIDELRAQVELKTQQQLLVAEENQLAKDKLTLARVIGLPAGQAFEISDTAPYAPLEALTQEQALQRAYASRADYQSLRVQVEAAETDRQAVEARRYPTLELNGNYGDTGVNLAQSHGTFTVTGSLKFIIFDSGRRRADADQSDVVLKQRKQELADLQG
ncbi:MAG TPA: TolC family protein, partial [Bryobacteraceae bacterium]|nr:TolC family protein [Bryobacteraceae bacterium]